MTEIWPRILGRKDSCYATRATWKPVFPYWVVGYGIPSHISRSEIWGTLCVFGCWVVALLRWARISLLSVTLVVTCRVDLLQRDLGCFGLRRDRHSPTSV
jgi:hypothetical protein